MRQPRPSFWLSICSLAAAWSLTLSCSKTNVGLSDEGTRPAASRTPTRAPALEIVQRALSATRAQLQVTVDRRDSDDSLTLQLKVPDGVTVSSGKRFTTIAKNAGSPKSQLLFDLQFAQLPVGDAVFTLQSPTQTIEQRYTFGRASPNR